MIKMLYRARIFQAFFKITGLIPQALVFRTKIYYEDRAVQGRMIHRKAIVVSNHLSVFDYIPMIFVFLTRVTRCVTAEVLFSKNFFLSLFLRLLGCMKVDRAAHDLSFEETAFRFLDKNGTVVFYPEGRVPDREGDVAPLEFKTTFVYMALKSGAPLIPYYCNGKVFSKERCKVIIGKPINVKELYDENLSEKENRRKIADLVRDKIIFLREEMERQDAEEDK